MTHILQDDRQPGWYYVDNSLLDDYGPKVGAIGIAVYSILARHANKARVSWPSYSTIAAALDLSRPTVIASVKALVQHGLISVETVQQPGRRPFNRYTLRKVGSAPTGKRPLPVNEIDQSTGKADLLVKDVSLTGKRPLPEMVKQVDSNKTQLTRHKEQDPLGVASQPRARETLATFVPNEKQIEDAAGYGVPLERIAFETEQWRDYHAEKGTPIKDFGASWRRWMRNAPAFERPRGSPPTNGRTEPVTFQQQIAINNRRNGEQFLAAVERHQNRGQQDVPDGDEQARRLLPHGG